jgi:hypothetical protein
MYLLFKVKIFVKKKDFLLASKCFKKFLFLTPAQVSMTWNGLIRTPVSLYNVLLIELR